MLRAGDKVGGRFRLVKPIGSGGMGSVWWARHALIDRDVALKLLPVVSDAPTVLSRFEREAQIIGKMSHPNIVSVLDAGELEAEGYLFLAMELLRGSPFSDRLVPDEPLPAADVLPVLIGVCHGLEHAHAAGVVHRDVKPENIFLAVTESGVVPKIVDFGISQSTDARRQGITVEGQILGTPAYMSPEQARGLRDIDLRTDLWSVGVILHEALTGSQPFSADRPHALLRAIIDDPPPPLPESIDPALAAIVTRCLQKRPEDRYADAAALRRDLEAALSRVRGAASTVAGATAPMTAASAPRPEPLAVTLAGDRPRQASRRAWIAPAIAAAAALVLVASVPHGEGGAAEPLPPASVAPARLAAAHDAPVESEAAPAAHPASDPALDGPASDARPIGGGPASEARPASAGDRPSGNPPATRPSRAARPLTRVSSPGF